MPIKLDVIFFSPSWAQINPDMKWGCAYQSCKGKTCGQQGLGIRPRTVPAMAVGSLPGG